MHHAAAWRNRHHRKNASCNVPMSYPSNLSQLTTIMAANRTPFTPSRRYFDLPEILASDSWNNHGRVKSPIPVIPLFQTTPEERETIITKLGNPVPADENVAASPRELAIIPWLRNYTPVVEDVIFDLCGTPTMVTSPKHRLFSLMRWGF